MNKNAIIKTRTNGFDGVVPLPAEGTNVFHAWASAAGRRATMPIVMMSEIPLPMPRSVIWSPSHIKKSVPVVSEITVMIRKLIPRFSTRSIPNR